MPDPKDMSNEALAYVLSSMNALDMDERLLDEAARRLRALSRASQERDDDQTRRYQAAR